MHPRELHDRLEKLDDIRDGALRQALRVMLEAGAGQASETSPDPSLDHQIPQKPQIPQPPDGPEPRGSGTRPMLVGDPLTEPLHAVVAELNRVYLDMDLGAADLATPPTHVTAAEARLDAAAQEQDWPRAFEALSAWREASLAAFARAKARKQERTHGE